MVQLDLKIRGVKRIGGRDVWTGGAEREGEGVCVLLVEDEPLIREIMAEGLLDAGFEVVEARDGEAAIKLICDPPRVFSVLVTDFHMPGRYDGAAVASRMRRSCPKMPVVIATGRPEVLHPDWSKKLGYTFLRKPYTAADLVSVLEHLLKQR